MRVTPRDPSKGILDFSSALTWFTLHRHAPASDLQSWIESYWVVEWDLPEGHSHRQTNLSHSSINVAIEPEGAFLYGVPARTFVKTIAGKGHVFGIKFRPGGFFPYFGKPVSDLTGKSIPFSGVFGNDGRVWARAMAAAFRDEERAALADSFWRLQRRALASHFSEGPSLSTLAAERIMNDRSILTVAQAARQTGVDVRALQRLFSREVGTGPKEVIRRIRLQQSAERLASEPRLSCGELALEMGYFDQAHFVRDFKAVVGVPPDAYRRRQPRNDSA
ncbi:MAG: helix-turn-helix domain-containing protein [Spirochaetia bacterium]|jgi:AraC-like DNA-binding protein